MIVGVCGGLSLNLIASSSRHSLFSKVPKFVVEDIPLPKLITTFQFIYRTTVSHAVLIIDISVSGSRNFACYEKVT